MIVLPEATRSGDRLGFCVGFTGTPRHNTAPSEGIGAQKHLESPDWWFLFSEFIMEPPLTTVTGSKTLVGRVSYFSSKLGICFGFWSPTCTFREDPPFPHIFIVGQRILKI